MMFTVYEKESDSDARVCKLYSQVSECPITYVSRAGELSVFHLKSTETQAWHELKYLHWL